MASSTNKAKKFDNKTILIRLESIEKKIDCLNCTNEKNSKQLNIISKLLDNINNTILVMDDGK